MYTLDMTAMSDLVEEAHQRYIESSKRNIIIHSIDAVCFILDRRPFNTYWRALRPSLSSLAETSLGTTPSVSGAGRSPRSSFDLEWWSPWWKMHENSSTQRDGTLMLGYLTVVVICCSDHLALEKVGRLWFSSVFSLFAY